MNRHPALLRATWLNWSNCSPDDAYRSLLNILKCESIQLHFILSALCWSSAELMGTLKKARPFFWDRLHPKRVRFGPPAAQPAPPQTPYSLLPLLLCDCVSAVWSDVTLRRHYPHHCASSAALHWKPALTAMTPPTWLDQWPPDPPQP